MKNQSNRINASTGVERQLAFDNPHVKEHHQDQLLQGLAAAIYTCDSQGYIKTYNKAAANLWGREPVIGKDVWCGSWKIFHPDGSPLSFDECPMAQTLKQGRSVRGQEIMIERPDGQRLNIMAYPDPIFDNSGTLVEAVNLLVDITELKQKELALKASEEKLKQVIEELEVRIEGRTKDLKDANHQLQRINSELEQFAFLASHDMQEPLRKISIFTQRLEQRSANKLDEIDKSYIDKIVSSAKRMAELIDAILNYSRLPHLDEQFEKTNLAEVLKDTLIDFEFLIEKKNAVIIGANLPVLKAIPLQMSQLFHNIIGNSLKFCRDGVSCKVTITSKTLSPEETDKYHLDKNRSYCNLTFTDNGIGFDQDYGKDIFKIFKRLNSKDKLEGTGIGLALCRKIVEIHQGKIFAESKEGEGTTMHVILPL